MREGFYAENRMIDGNPAGGVVCGRGFTIAWQNGPLGRGEERKEPNGAFVEDVIAAALQRLEFYQTVGDGKFACAENEKAITSLMDALRELDNRTKRREAEGTEGTHKVDSQAEPTGFRVVKETLYSKVPLAKADQVTRERLERDLNVLHAAGFWHHTERKTDREEVGVRADRIIHVYPPRTKDSEASPWKVSYIP